MNRELVLIRRSNDVDAVTSVNETEKPMTTIEKLYWRIPHSVGISQLL